MTYRLGLTGGIASGKSAVSAQLRAAGVPVIDADVIARDIVAPGQPALAAIVAEFGPGILQADGTLDRHALGQLVFADPAKLARLNALDRPYLRQAILAALAAAAKPGVPLVIGDIPLLYEADFTPYFDGIAVVSVSPATQLRRLMTRDGLSQTAAKQRIAAQMPLAEKVAKADFVIANDGTPEQREQQVAALLKRLS